MNKENMPEIKIGVVAVSRDCFPESLSVNRRKALMDAYTKKYGKDHIYECPICIVESEIHMVQALEDVKAAGCDALVVYLGNFGPEIAETLLAKHFDKYENMKKQPGAYFHVGYPLKYYCYNVMEMAFPRFTGFYTVHGPSPLKKSTYETLWQAEPELLRKVCSHPFRHKEDVSQYVIREWQKLSGDFVNKNSYWLCKYFDVSEHNEKLLRMIRKHTGKIACVNDSNHGIDFEKAKAEINAAFAEGFPERSAFECE